MRIVVDSDGTAEGTTLKIDGRVVTDDEDVTSVNFYASVGYSRQISFGYNTREENEDGSTEVNSYNYYKSDGDDDGTIRKAPTPLLGRGSSAEDSLDKQLVSQARIGGTAYKVVVDRSKILPGMEGAIQDLIVRYRREGKKVVVIDSGDNEDAGAEEG